MDQAYETYLELLSSLRDELKQLSDLTRQKIQAVCNDDLEALDAILKQEQALSLSLRGLDQRRAKLLREMQLEDVPLSALPSRYPQTLQMQARRAVEALKDQYQLYQGCAEAARNTLEINIHQIERTLEAMDPGNHEPDASGYAGYAASATAETEPPKSMKTDFLA
jgi:flagellar biosynthesis/type III secretory pathway chaperone